MRHKTYFRFNSSWPDGGSDAAIGPIEEVPFTADHFRQIGALVTPEVGMHEVTALQLLNKWNRLSIDHGLVYYL